MDDLGEWLERVGLGQYRSAFAVQHFASETLRHLTDSDFERLGLSVGHRRKLQEAIGARWPPCPISKVSALAFHERVERRNLTVMFCDLVGSTALSARLDPEDLREIILGYQNRVATVVKRFGGHVARYLGDGILAYFGWPMAAEDDAVRAVAAALGIVDAMRTVGIQSQPLQTRIGIATGLVVVGDLIGEGAAREETAIGEVPNIAARLQALASPNTVLVGKGTRQLLGRAFDLESLGCVQLKGWDEALPIWQVIGENRLPTRFPGLGPEHTVALMGRNFELSLLHSRWQQALQRRGQLVMLFGEAGIGKSRTAAAFNAQIRETRHETLVYQCLPQRTRDPLHPIVRQIEFAAGFTHAEAPEHKLDKLEALLARFGNSSPERNDVFASLLSLPVSARCQDLDFGSDS